MNDRIEIGKATLFFKGITEQGLDHVFNFSGTHEYDRDIYLCVRKANGSFFLVVQDD